MQLPDNSPDLKSLQIFEVAARHLSFTRAAGELRLLQPAVSRQVITLEQALGVQLFLRTKPRLTLTTEGETLYAAVSTSMEHIRGAVREIRERRKIATLVVDATIGFISCYLIHYLGDFYKTYPEIELELLTRDQNRCDERSADIAILFDDRGYLPGVEAHLIVPETLVAVCSEAYLPAAQEPLSLESLIQEKLLFMDNVHFRDDWERYLQGTGLQVDIPNRAQRFFSYMVYLQAALNGDGVILTLEKLVQKHLQNHNLRLACEHKVPTSRGYHVCFMERALEKPGARLFMDWLLSLEGHDPS